ncbi:hypothetical protein M413DRAFT_420896 [Hebeloma cylindrosporum]|uniref:WSC domain-containing protein n=1 Tax=Hebeloma cylindrosporum TaxID=76867 RepID=A0A0C2YB80_HEBCY|nr:hypothetical protein M413DRAFT_420896 [Hebeloma cylindrosporum h7]
MAFIVACLAILAALLPLSAALPSSPDHANILQRQDNPNPNAPGPGWTFVGCFTDSVPASRTLIEATIVNPNMTPNLCTSFCSGTDFATPFNFAGTEFTSECYCGLNIQGTATQVDDTLCNFPCGGDNTLVCGGAGYISVYKNSNDGVGPIPSNKDVPGWTFDGCHTDAVGDNPRTLLERFDIPDGVTIESCTALCAANGFNITGLEFGQECWCGSSFLVEGTEAPLRECSRACQADHSELCGASSRLSVYVAHAINPTTTAEPSVTPTPTTTEAPTTTEPTTTEVPVTTTDSA